MVNKKAESKNKKKKVRKSIGDALKIAISTKQHSKTSIASSRSINSVSNNKLSKPK
jgi:hypothetical protein